MQPPRQGKKSVIELTQYIRPHGRKQTVYAPTSQAVEAMANRIVEAGFKFECEVLTTGEVSLTISSGHEDVAIEICQNGPEVQDTLSKLVQEFYVKTLAEGSGQQ